MKQFLLAAIVLAIIIAVVLVAARQFWGQRETHFCVSQGPTVDRLERLAHLVTTRVYVADVLVGEGRGCRGAWLIKGDAVLGIELRRAKVIEKDEVARRAVVRLPQPDVLQSRVDHYKTRAWEVLRTSWIPWSTDEDRLRDEVMRQAQTLVGDAARSAENISQAKTSAETTLRAFYEEFGWQVQFVWDGQAAGNQPGPSQ